MESFLLNGFPWPALVVLLLMHWHVACTYRESGSHHLIGKVAPQWCAKSSSVTKTSQRANSASSAHRVHQLSYRLEPFAASNTATTATCRIGRMCDSITREALVHSNTGVLLCKRQWFRQLEGSIPGDAGGPSALDALPSLEHSTARASRLILPDGDEEIMTHERDV